MPAHERITLHRTLDARQQQVHARVLAQARLLIGERGHEAVGMGDIAKAAGVSRATLYRYFASRDHIVAEVALAWARSVSADLIASSARRRTLGGLVRGVLDGIVDEAATDPAMLRAILSSLIAEGPGADSFRQSVEAQLQLLFASRFEGVAEQDAVGFEMLGRLLLANLALLGAGAVDAATCKRQLARFAEVALGDKQHTGL
jgi:AcrR family transcriptional regulator